MIPPIEGFKGPHRYLSNFSQATVVGEDGLFYRTVEHAYQATKTVDVNYRREIGNKVWASQARMLGRMAPVRPGWEEMKVGVMRRLLLQKFDRKGFRWQLLKSTAPRELIETNHWGDKFWGVYKGVGENHLGKLLMEIRDAETT